MWCSLSSPAEALAITPVGVLRALPTAVGTAELWGLLCSGAEGDVYIAVWRLCVFHKLLAFPVTGGGSNIGVIELSWHHSEEHSGVGGQSGSSGRQPGELYRLYRRTK